MAKRKFLLAIGQSNSTAIGDAQSWEDKYIQVALRNPQVNPPQYAEGSYTDMLTLPYIFPGGPQSRRLGEGPKVSAWQSVNCKGRAVQALRFLTFYEPVAGSMNIGTSYSLKYPGTASVLAGSTPSTLATTIRWQTNPYGSVLTRKSTGLTYTVTSTQTSTNTVTVTPDILPAPVEGEEFSTQFKAGLNSPNASTLIFAQQFGGINDIGTALEGGYISREVVNPKRSDGTWNPMRLKVLDRPLRVGQAVMFQAASTTLEFVTSMTNGTANIDIGTPTVDVYQVGTPVKFTIVSGTMTPLVPNQSYYIVYRSGSTIRVSLTQGGSPITITSYSSVIAYEAALPNGLQAATAYYISRRSASQERLNVGSFVTVAGPTQNCLQFSSPHKLASGDLVRVSINSAPFVVNQDYYVLWVDQTNVQLSLNSGGGAITLSAPMVAGLQLIKQHSAGEYFLRRPKTSTVASVDAGTNEITLQAGHFLSVGDTVEFASSNTLPGGISAATPYKIKTITGALTYRVITLQDPAVPANTLDITSTGSGTITMTQTGGQEEMSCDGSVYIGQYILEQWRGSLTGLVARCTAGTAGNVGQSRPMGDVYYDAGNACGVVELGSAFPATPQAGDTFVIEAPSYNGAVIPMQKWAMWLPWSPFEGAATSTSFFTMNLSSNFNDIVAVGGGVRFFPNTQVQFYGFPDVVDLVDTSAAGSTATTINANATMVLNEHVGRYIRFVNGALAGQARKVLSNTTNQLVVDTTLASGFSAAPTAGDTYQIMRFFTHPGVTIGKNYYVRFSATNGFYFSETYNGPQLTAQFEGAVNMNVIVLPQQGKSNPYPPGFNYPNHLTPIAGLYQPFDGPSYGDQPRSGHYVSTALKMHDYLGEVMHVIPLAFGGTGLSHKEMVFGGGEAGKGDAWYDPDQQVSWSPGDSNNCFGRLMDVLDAAKLAFEQQGDTGECVGIVWAQGEDDASFEDRASRYYYNCTSFKKAVRQAIKDRNLYSGNASRIPWIHPKVRNFPGWVYNATLNAGIERMVEEDPYSRFVEVDDLDMSPDLVHYSGLGMSQLSERIFAAWLSINKMGSSEVDICNLALANIGETAKVTSIEPPDGSAQAALCATFYPLARDSLLQMGCWSFAIKRKALTAVVNPRTEWQFAYEVPGDASGVIAVTPSDASNDYIENGMDVPQKFVIETDINGKRILYTNQKDAHARYNAKIVDTTLFSTIFTISLSWHLASMLAGPIIKGDVGAAESKRCAQVASAYMMQAKTHDATTQAEIKPPHTPSWINWR